MDDLYASGSILVLFFSGISGSAFLSNNYDSCFPVRFEGGKGFVQINKSISRSELLKNYMFLRSDGHYLTKYKMYC